MKLLVLGFEAIPSKQLLEDESFQNLRRLMDLGCFGTIDPVIPATPIPSWLSFLTGRDPGSIGIYGLRNRTNHSTTSATPVQPTALRSPTISDLIQGDSGRVSVLGFPYNRTDHRPLFQAAQKNLETDPHHLVVLINRPDLTIPDEEYYQKIDHEVGQLLGLIDDETAVLVLSLGGSQGRLGGVALNDWLVHEGYLAVRSKPTVNTSLEEVVIDWAQTKAWSVGGPAGLIFLNVEGREPAGIVPESEASTLRDELKAKIEALELNGSTTTEVFKPEECYQSITGVAPDLIVQFGALSWSVLDQIGDHQLLVPNDPTPHGNDPDIPGPGGFILAADGLPIQGQLEGVRLLDLPPTLLDLVKIPIPNSLQGQSLLSRSTNNDDGSTPTISDEEIIRNRLSGLGYL